MTATKRQKWWQELNVFRGEGGYNEIWRVAYPLVIMSASHTIMQFCDRKFLAMNSTIDVAAALPAGILSFTLFSFFMVTVNFTAALVSQYFGDRNREACVRAVWNGFYLALAASLLIVLVIPWLGLHIIDISGHGPEVISRERAYYISLIPSGAFVCLGAAFCAYFSGQGKTWYIAAINTAACAVNIALDYVMIFGKYGFPAMGITGAGVATSISTLCSFLAAMILFLAQNQKVYPTRSHRLVNLPDLKRLLFFGTPSGIQCFIDVGAFTAFTFMIGTISREALAISTIVCSINMLSFLPLLGISDATGILVGQYIGRNQHHTAEKVAYRAWMMAAAYMIVAGAVFVLLPEWLIGNFAPNRSGDADFGQIVRTGQQVLICAAIYNFFDATKFIFTGALRGSGDTRVLMLIGLGFNWLLLVPGIFLLVKVCEASVLTVWIFLSVYLLFESLGIFWRFRSGAWRKIKLIERRSAAEAEVPGLPDVES